MGYALNTYARQHDMLFVYTVCSYGFCYGRHTATVITPLWIKLRFATFPVQSKREKNITKSTWTKPLDTLLIATLW